MEVVARPAIFLALALMSAPLLISIDAGAQGNSAPTVLLTDPSGDATDANAATAVATATNACWAASPAASTACRAARDAAEPGERANEATEGHGTPAPPEVDILEISALETPSAVELRMKVARLDAEALASMDRRPSWNVAWQADPAGCGEAVWMYLRPDGTPRAGLEHWDLDCLVEDPTQHPWAGACNDWSWCTEKVDVELAYGAPGTITWKVPRDSLIDPAQGASLYDLSASTMLGQRGDGAKVRWWVPVVDPVEAGGVVLTSVQGEADRTETAEPFELQVPHVPTPRAPGTSQRETFPSESGVGTDVREDMDVIALELTETEDTISMRVELALVEVSPADDAYLWFALGLPSGHVVEAVAEGIEGTWVARSAMRAPGYGDPLQQYTIQLPVVADVQPGRPGSVTLTFDRGDLPFIGAGDRTNLFVLVSAASGPDNEVDEAVGPTKVWARVEEEGGDYTDGAVPYEFLHDSPEPQSAGALIVDEQGDARLSERAVVGGASRDLFDITHVEVRPQADGNTRFTMGIRDLGGMRVPIGYEAVYYAFGVETPDGPQMIGYYKNADDPAGTFLCATDTTVTVDASSDPTSAVWTVIDGLLQVAGGPDGSGSGGPGSITWIVPNECLGAESGEDVALDRIEAATFLVSNPTGRNGEGSVERADEATMPEGLAWSPGALLTANAVAAPQSGFLDGTAWYWWAMRAAGVVGGPVMFVVARRAKRRDKAAEQQAIYRAAVEQALRAGREPDIDDDVLVGLRKRFGISDRMHALIVQQAREGMGRTPSTLAPGAVFLDRYVVEEVIGQGGFGLTYLAHDRTLDRKVVLKAARWDSPKEQRRALEEARTLARLGHPNIVTVIDAERVGDEVVMVLEHVSGGSLAERLEAGPLTTDQLDRLAKDVCAALEAAHEADIVHRDVKPGNILLTSTGAAKLCDFGIARSDGTGTVTGSSVGSDAAGTVAYMAPEQARGLPPDHRADIYALGAVLYEAATGRTYIDLDGMAEFEARLAIVDREPDLPVETLPPDLNDVLTTCLAKDPGLRPQSIAQLRNLLEGTNTTPLAEAQAVTP